MRFLILALLLVACGKKHAVVKYEGDVAQLRVKRDHYIALSNAQGRPDGFVRGCDGLLFTGLGAAGGLTANIQQAEVEPGHWLRRPISHGPCYFFDNWDIFVQSSEISRDMILGLLEYAIKKQDWDIGARIVAYAKRHGNTLGEGATSRTSVTPQLYGTLYEMVYKNGGENNPTRFIPLALPKDLEGYEAHLLILHILLRYQLTGITDGMSDTVEVYANAHPQNAFFQAVKGLKTGSQEEALALLMDGAVFPADRLPGSDEYCEPYRWQRDGGADWQPCPLEAKIHSGADFIFVASLILGE